MNADITVLHVDPSAADRESVAAAFDSASATLESVSEYATALDALDGDDVDCIVSEAELPDGDGLDLFDTADCPFVFYTDSGDESFAGRAIALGADGYVPKEDGAVTLVERVTALAAETDGRSDAPAAEGATRESRHSHPMLVEQSPLAIIEWDLDFRAVEWNPAAVDLFGYERAEALGEDPTELILPAAERETVEAVWDDLIAGEGGRRLINENVRKDGTAVVCEWNNAPLATEDGEVVGVLSFVRDVSEQVRHTDALESLQETTREMMRAETKDEVAETVVDAVSDLLGQSLAGVRLYDEESERLEPVAATDAAVSLLGERPSVGPGDGLMWEAFAADEQAVYDTVPVNETVYGDLFPEAIKSISFFPLGDHGVLILGSRGTDGFDDTDVHLANVVATTTTVALDSAERRRELERRDTIVEAVGDGVYALDTDGRFTAVNDTLLSRTGYAREELLGEHVSALLGPEEIKRGRRLISELRDNEDESVKTYEASIRTRDGDRIPCEVNLSLLPADAGFVGTVGTVRDVSERKEFEDALRQQKRKVRNLHQVASQLESCETPSAIYEYAVRAAQQVLNFDICVVQRIDGDESVIESISSGPLPDDLERRRDFGNDLTALTYRTEKTYRINDIRDDDVAARTSEDYRAVLSVPIGDQGVFQAISTSVGAFDDSDEELAELLIAHVENALDRVQFETDLRDERDRFAALFENVPDAVASVRNEDGRTVITDVNEAFERIFGYTTDEITGRPLEETIIPPEGVDNHQEIKRRATAGETVEREVTRRTVDGLREFVLTVVPVEVGAKDSERYAVYTDITERKQRRKRVEVLNRVLRHDLRNGMNIIRGNAEMLRGEVPADLTAAVDAIEARTTELIEMAEKTRLVERTLRDGDQTTGPVDVIDAVTAVVERVRDEHPESTVECSCPDSAHASASSRLQTAVYHVVDNAVVHNDSDAPQVEVAVRREEESIVVEVRDDGPGLPRTERELLVEDREITQLRHAGGLGLWLVNWVVQQSGGTLSFADNDPHGSVVTLQIPHAQLDTDTPEVGAEESDA